MKLSILTAATLLLAGAQAHAVSPCRAERLQALTCVVTNEAEASSLEIEVSRSRTVDSGGGRCTKVGELSETVIGHLSVPSRNNFSDLYFSAERLGTPFADVEQGRPVSLELSSGGLTTIPESGSVQLVPENGSVRAHIVLYAKVGSIYAKPDFDRIDIAGSATCF